MEFIFILFVYLFQGLIACAINAANGTRKPESFPDFLKLYCLLYVILNLKKIRQ